MDEVRDILLVESRHQMFKRNEVETSIIKQTVEESEVLDKCRVKGHIKTILQKAKQLEEAGEKIADFFEGWTAAAYNRLLARRECRSMATLASTSPEK